MDSRQLRYFVAVVESSSMSRAAETLHVSQPALSIHMHHLEEELGVPLLIRGPRGVLPTVHGKLLLEHARSILHQFRLAKQEVVALGKEPAGEVVIGIPATVSSVLIPPLLRTVKARYPLVMPRVIEAMTGFLLEWLHTGRLDAAIIFDVQSFAGLNWREIGTEELCLVGPSGAFKRGARVQFGALPQYPLILPGPMHGLNMLICQTAARAGIPLNVQIEVDSPQEMLGLVKQGMGYTLMAGIGFHRDLEAKSVSVARIAGSPLRRTLVCATRDYRPVSAAAQVVLDLSHAILADFIQSGTAPAGARRRQAARQSSQPRSPTAPAR
ncbi:LysR substrate-binding domain-containing protein [Pigmentiphaga soli]|uniref:LysR substrate-binding domain-containing protein n=1 Tax=Pigmentiphaga soli TaxID=1007095 RepID=A0ABP8HMW7_9BURK